MDGGVGRPAGPQRRSRRHNRAPGGITAPVFRRRPGPEGVGRRSGRQRDATGSRFHRAGDGSRGCPGRRPGPRCTHVRQVLHPGRAAGVRRPASPCAAHLRGQRPVTVRRPGTRARSFRPRPSGQGDAATRQPAIKTGLATRPDLTPAYGAGEGEQRASQRHIQETQGDGLDSQR